MKFSIHQASHIGNRKYNQDRAAYAYGGNALLLVLADGMGGHAHGEVAADLIIKTFIDAHLKGELADIADPDAFVAKTMRQAHESIMNYSRAEDMKGSPGSTCVVALIQGGTIHWCHAGDSRLYLLRDGEVFARTSDHSVVQHWVMAGNLTAEEARAHPLRNHITRCLGVAENMFCVESGEPCTMQPGDVLLLCSDGLWGPFTDQELVEAFSLLTLPDALDGLIMCALQREKGFCDNATGIAVRWGEGEKIYDTAQPSCHILEIS